jgi:hypothetical protein
MDHIHTPTCASVGDAFTRVVALSGSRGPCAAFCPTIDPTISSFCVASRWATSQPSSVAELGASPEPDGRTGDRWTPDLILSPKVHERQDLPSLFEPGVWGSRPSSR